MTYPLEILEIVERMTYPDAVLILSLDRLIKKRFIDKLENHSEEYGIDQKKITKIKEQIEIHNKQLLENLYSSNAEAKTANKKLQFITKLYGIKDHSQGQNPSGRRRASIQRFLDMEAESLEKDSNRLSEYFYDKLNKFVRESVGINGNGILKIRSDKLQVLFSIALPGNDLKDWSAYIQNPKVKLTCDQIIDDLKKQDSTLQDFIIFRAYYYSRSRKKIHNFELRLGKDNTTEGVVGYEERLAQVSFLQGKLEYKGVVTRKRTKVTVTLKKTNDDKRVILFAFVPQSSLFTDINIIQGIYIGDSVKREGEVFTMEFIAAKSEFLTNPDNEFRIITTLLLRRNNFDIQSHDLTTTKLDKTFLQRNLLDDKFKEIITRIQSHEILFLNYGKSGKILLSKIKFEEQFNIYLTAPISQTDSNQKKVMEQSCNLSARNKGRKIIATTYLDEHLNNVVVLDFKNPSESIFTGAFSHHSGTEVYTSFIIAIISGENKTQKPRELDTVDIETLREIKIYGEALRKLEKLRAKNLDYLRRIE